MRNVFSRLKKLEETIGENNRIAVFLIGFYENKDDQKQAQSRLMEEYRRAGNPDPSICIFVNEIPGPTKEPQEERFLSSFC